jgi:hypothetical protein
MIYTEYQKSRPERREKETNKDRLKPPIHTIIRRKMNNPIKPFDPKKKKDMKIKILKRITSNKRSKKI